MFFSSPLSKVWFPGLASLSSSVLSLGHEPKGTQCMPSWSLHIREKGDRQESSGLINKRKIMTLPCVVERAGQGGCLSISPWVLQENKSSYVLPFLIPIAKFLKCCHSGACCDRSRPGKVTGTPRLEPSLWIHRDKPSHDHLVSEEVGYGLVPHTAPAETHPRCL